jgi:DNA polymerase-4
MRRALRLCPQAVRLEPRFDRYVEVSRQVIEVYRSVTPLVEPLSLDEAFLEVTNLVHDFQDAELLARRVKSDVRRATGLTASIGVATNKSVAKIASDQGKPNGLVMVRPGEEPAFLAPLPVEVLWGIGPRTAAALARIGVRVVGELAVAEEAALTEVLGSGAAFFKRLAQGFDERPLQLTHERKSVGVERTFAQDLADGPELRAELHDIALEVAARLSEANVSAQLIVLKLRYANFRTKTRQHVLPAPASGAPELEDAALSLLMDNVHATDRFRLLGLRCTRLLSKR